MYFLLKSQYHMCSGEHTFGLITFSLKLPLVCPHLKFYCRAPFKGNSFQNNKREVRQNFMILPASPLWDQTQKGQLIKTCFNLCLSYLYLLSCSINHTAVVDTGFFPSSTPCPSSFLSRCSLDYFSLL